MKIFKENPTPRKLFVSLHIPKTGGTSLREVLSAKFGSGFNTAYGNLAAKSAKTKNVGYPITCIHGHDIVSQYNELLVATEKQTWITFLRDPLEGAVSFYYFTRKSLNKDPGNPMFVDNGLEAWLLNTKPNKWPFPPGYPNNRYMKAIQRTNRTFSQYKFVGVTERFEESMQCMFKILGWENMPYDVLNKGTYIAPHLSSQVVDKFRENNSIDYALYDNAKRNIDGILLK